MKKSHILVGRFGKAFGVKGMGFLISYTEPIEKIFDYKKNLLLDNGTAVVIENWRKTHHQSQKGLIVKIANINSRNDYEGFVGKDIFILREKLPPLKTGVYYQHDLIDYQVVAEKNDGTKIHVGRVIGFSNFGAGDVMVVGDDKKKQWLVSWQRSAIIAVNQEDATIIVRENFLL